jgi:hypothetical protein
MASDFVRRWLDGYSSRSFPIEDLHRSAMWPSRSPGPEVSARLDAAYHAKYDCHGPGMVGTVVSPEAARSTLRLAPS